MERQEPDRRDMGREKFLERVWAWKAESGGAIVEQLKRLGASCDWSRERFTMDEGLSRAVAKVFVELYRRGLIYKDKRLVNWDPQAPDGDLRPRGRSRSRSKGTPAGTSKPDPARSRTGWTETGERRHRRHDAARRRCSATPRSRCIPRTSATSIWSASDVSLPLVGRLIPIVADEYADPEKGAGAVKITPAHDFNDFEVGKPPGLPRSISSMPKRHAAQGQCRLPRRRGASDRTDDDRCARRPRSLRRAQARRRDDGGARPARQDRAACASWCRTATARACRSSLGSPTNGMSTPRRWRSRRSPRCARAGPISSQELGEDLFRLAGEHPALVRLAPALVGSPDPGVVRAWGAVYVAETEDER